MLLSVYFIFCFSILLLHRDITIKVEFFFYLELDFFMQNNIVGENELLMLINL